jgi:predicted metal-dependent phosphoesterase TrpH
VRYKGALHIHSTLSHDGTLSIPDLARWYRHRGYHFVAIGEHSQDLDNEKLQALCEACGAQSNENFCVIPGVEFSCREGIHIFGLGAVGLTSEVDPVAVTAKIHSLNGVAILAHPKRMKWTCSREILLALDGVEIWNVAYDGKYLPSFHAPRAFRGMREVNPRLLAVAGHDFHRKASFYDVGTEVEAGKLSAATIVEAIRDGRYSIRSRFFRADSRAQLSCAKSVWISLLSWQLMRVRQARDTFVRWSS